MNNITFSCLVIPATFHHSGPDRCHLGPVIWTEDCRHNITAECRPYLEKVFCLLINCKGCAICSKPCPYPCCDPGEKRASDRCCTGEHNFRPMFNNQ